MSLNTPTISVVMPVYNNEKYLDDSIRSILNQTYSNFEFIIINDGSTDGSLAIINSYLKKDDRIILINKENTGISQSLNEGIKISKGKYIARMDGDDISASSRLFEQLNLMEHNSEIGVCSTSALIFNEDKKIINCTFHPKLDYQIKCMLLFNSSRVHPAAMIRKNILYKRDFIYAETFINSQDYELWNTLARHTKFYNIQSPLYFIRKNYQSISSKADENILKNRFPFLKTVHERNIKSLGFKGSNEELKMMFVLSSNLAVKSLDIRVEQLKKFIFKIIINNNNLNLYDKIYLKKYLFFRFYVYLIILNKFNIFKFLFSSFLLQGLYELIKYLIVKNSFVIKYKVHRYFLSTKYFNIKFYQK